MRLAFLLGVSSCVALTFKILISFTTPLTALLLSTCVFLFLCLLSFFLSDNTKYSMPSFFLTCHGFLLCYCSKLLWWCRISVFFLCSSIVYNILYYWSGYCYCSCWCILVFSIVINWCYWCCCSFYDYGNDFDYW